ncbi:putative non-heme bromoperoxidase BpoC [Agromyces sp. NDB4Y10]|uniref:alpha/beta fold hydrolase n=1 Tax=Agromyces sp. NDB4Y10 TaxID=1775951 RepID=UPI0007B287CB|nr:alpha/beta hydrolase [Agromyces sp. NDB4Y10]KZE93232.1 putative non-heme bromoperoxidase BpoC [Agromyces sp. NDB4Y10]
MGKTAMELGTVPPGLPYIRLGTGRPLLFLPGITGHHRLPEGMELTFQTRPLRPFAASREVWWVNRRAGLPARVTMTEIAEDYADVIRSRLGAPVDVFGMSTGASVALALAVEHPELVRRLVVQGAYRLGDHGRRIQQEMARELRAGRPRRAGAIESEAVAAGAVTGGLMRAMGWLTGRSMYGGERPDLLAVIDAEDAFDVGDRLREITAPTLVIGGARDRFYGADLFRETAERIPDGRLVLYPDHGHMVLGRRFTSDVLAFLDA